MKEAIKTIYTAIDSTSVIMEKHGADSAYQNFNTAFPVSACLGCYLYVSIDFEDGFISMPIEGSDDNHNSSTFDEFYKNRSKIQLGRLVTEQSYRTLLDKIVPLVAQITIGYKFEGFETMASFTSEAKNALEELSMFNVDIDDTKIWDVEDIYEYYANNSTFVNKKNGEVAFSHFGEELVMSNSSNDELKFAAQIEIENQDDEINLYDLISYLQDLRELCIEHKDDHSDSL